MRITGFCMSTGVSFTNAEDNMYGVFNKEKTPNIDNIYGEHNFEVIGVDKTEQYDMDVKQIHDVHYGLVVPQLQLIKDTEESHGFENLISTSLGLSDDNDDNDEDDEDEDYDFDEDEEFEPIMNKVSYSNSNYFDKRNSLFIQ